MIDERTKKDLKLFPVLPEGRAYIYILLNDAGKIKIGKTRNIFQRYMSLCGSNGAGNSITQVYVSPVSYVPTLEYVMHNKFVQYRIHGTEWFFNPNDNTGNTLFETAIKELQTILSSKSYQHCDQLRKQAMFIKEKCYDDKRD